MSQASPGNAEAVSTDGSPVRIPRASINELAASLDGNLLAAGDGEFESRRSVWNGMIDRRPALVAACKSEADVAAAVRFADEFDLLVAIRGGGHGVAGFAVCDGGLVIDVRNLDHVDVDAGARRARVGGGCKLAQVDAATQAFGLAAPLGIVSATGVAGLTLSGGMGWLRRKHGLSCDSLISARVVTADGKVVTASAGENPDLLWALKGGGGNFGVVTEFEFELHPAGPAAYLLFNLYPISVATEVLQGCTDFLRSAPEDVAPLGILGHVPAHHEFPVEAHGDPFVALLCLLPGDPESAESALAPLRGLAEPIVELGGPTTYAEGQAALDEEYPDGLHYFWKSIDLSRLDNDAIATLVELNAAAVSPLSTIDVWFQGGEMARRGGDASFPGREAPYLIGVEANWEPGDTGVNESNIAWARETIDRMRHFSAGGSYLNFPGFSEDTENLASSGYGRNHDRLVEIKRRFDPVNRFRLNVNLAP